MVNVFPSGKAIGSLRGGTFLESLPVTILRTVSILESEPKLSFSLSSEEEEDRTLRDRFLEVKETEILLEECLAIQ